MKRNPQISETQLQAFLAEAARAGVDIARVLEGLGFGSDWQDQAVMPELSLIDFFRIEGEVARRLDDLTAHLSERKLTFETGAFVTTQLHHSTTLCDAITSLAKHFNMMHGEHYNTVRVTDRTVSLIIDDGDFPYTMRDDQDMIHFIGECVLIQVYCLLDSLSDGLAERALQRVSVKRTSRKSLPEHLQFWNVPLSLNQTAYELSFDHELALAPMSKTGEIDLSSEGIYSRVIAYLETHATASEFNSFSARSMDLIRQGVTQQDIVAHRLSLSVATLRRRLESEGTTFRQLVNDHRLSEAVTLLEKGYSVARVSEMLDYSDIRAFNRAFKRWKGETPAKFARRPSAHNEPV